MEIFNYPEKDQWGGILRRPQLDEQDLSEVVGQILNEVRVRGDEALLEYAERFDKIRLQDLRVSSVEIAQAGDFLSGELKAAVQAAMHHI